ncbi:MAG: hypothetical protein NTV39_02275 [Candidatus Saccharibacteria bacterium]|nr:hypothetical protein [Candidatus Saccharibacteria bacterium]
MKKDGIGGAKTVTGLRFEKEVNLLSKIIEVPGYMVVGNKIFYKGKLLAESYPQAKLYTQFLKDRGINYLDYISKQYRPDEAIYVPEQNTIYIIEMKFQNSNGSVDEKLQTCDFKRKMYQKVLSKLHINVEYTYLLSSYFDVDRYRDAFEYMQSVGCDHYFNELPLSWLKFPEPVVLDGQYDPEDVEVSA